jgi:phage tail-like protein
MPASTSAGGAIKASRFSLTIDGVEIAQFSELVAIISEAEPDDIAGKVLKKLPGKRTPPTITLRRALTTDLDVAAWHETAADGRTKEAHRNAILVMFDAAGDPVARYNLENAWPSKIEVGTRTAASDDLMETVTLVCDAARRVAP